MSRAIDNQILDVLRQARRQNDSFGVAMDDGDPRLEALARLKDVGLVTTTTWKDGTVWWQAAQGWTP